VIENTHARLDGPSEKRTAKKGRKEPSTQGGLLKKKRGENSSSEKTRKYREKKRVKHTALDARPLPDTKKGDEKKRGERSNLRRRRSKKTKKTKKL